MSLWDAKTFADWGVDFLKYDYCYKPDGMPGELLYKRMAMAFEKLPTLQRIRIDSIIYYRKKKINKNKINQ